jgi:hypothetical protein
MTERERWVVYPLLFLALGASLRDKLVDQTVTKRIVCQELTIQDDESDSRYPSRVYAQLGRTEATANSPSHGFLRVDGEIGVNGLVNVNGVVNAGQYLTMIPRTQPPAGSSPGVPRRAMPSERENRSSGNDRAASGDSSANAQPSNSNKAEATPEN